MNHILLNDPGRRGLSFAHSVFFKNLASCHQVAADSFLCQMKRSDSSLYWTIMGLNGQLAKVPEELIEQLTFAEGDLPATSQLLMGGGVTQILARGKGSSVTKVVSINPRFEVVASKEYEYEVMQNCHGDLVEVQVQYVKDELPEDKLPADPALAL